MDARTSRYHDVYARWQRDPEGFWGEAAAGDRLVSRSRRRSSTRMPASTAAGSPAASATPATTRSTATSLAGRNDQAGADLRFAGHQHQADLHLRPHAVRGAIARRHAARLRRQQRRRRHPLYADGAGGGVRHAGLRAHRRHPFGGVRRLRGQGARHPHRRRQAEGDPVRELRHRRRARRALQAAARRGDQARQAQAADLPDPAAPAMRGDADGRPRPRLAQDLGARGQLRQDLRMRAGRRHRSALHPLHLRHHRHPERRGARQWRPHGRAQMVDAKSLRRQAGRGLVVAPPTSAGWSATPTSSMRRCSTAHLDHVRGQAGRHARRRRLLARLRRPRRGGAVHRADRVPRHQEGRPGRASCSSNTTCRKFRTLFLAGERADPPTIQWAEEHAESAGDRPLVADRDRLVHRRQSGGPRRAAGEIRLGLRADAGLRRSTSSTRPAIRCRPTRSARSWSSCRCRRPISRRCGSRTTASRKATSTNFPATTRRPTPATRTTTATSSS